MLRGDLGGRLRSSLGRVLSKIGASLFAAGSFEAAATMFRRAVALVPTSPWHHYDLGKALLACRRFTEASTALQRTIALDATLSWAHYNLGVVGRHQGRPERAIACFAQAIAHDPRLSWAHVDRIQLLLELERFEQAAAASRHAIDLMPDAYQPYLHLGETLTHDERIPEAIASFRTASRKQLAESHPHFRPSAVDARGAPPHFIAIGQAKCGTTFFYRLLTRHPQVLPAIKKEIRFWERDFHYGLDWYRAHFPAIADDQDFVTGEASPQYLDHDEAPERLSRACPETKLIILVRNPIRMVFSLYQMRRRTGEDERSWADIVTAELDAPLPRAGTFAYLRKGRYLDTIERWMTLFPSDRVFVLDCDQLFADPTAAFNEVFRFLGVRPWRVPRHRKENVGHYPAMNAGVRSELAAFFRPHNKRLERFLGRSFDWR